MLSISPLTIRFLLHAPQAGMSRCLLNRVQGRLLIPLLTAQTGALKVLEQPPPAWASGSTQAQPRAMPSVESYVQGLSHREAGTEEWARRRLLSLLLPAGPLPGTQVSTGVWCRTQEGGDGHMTFGEGLLGVQVHTQNKEANSGSKVRKQSCRMMVTHIRSPSVTKVTPGP